MGVELVFQVNHGRIFLAPKKPKMEQCPDCNVYFSTMKAMQAHPVAPPGLEEFVSMGYEPSRKGCPLPLPAVEEEAEKGVKNLEKAGKVLDEAFREIHQLEEEEVKA